MAGKLTRERRPVLETTPPHFLDEPLHVSVSIGMQGRSLWKGHRRTPSPTLSLPPLGGEGVLSKLGVSKWLLKRSTVRLIALTSMVCSILLWLYCGVVLDASTSRTTSMNVTPPSQHAEERLQVPSKRCESRAYWRKTSDREYCDPLLPDTVISSDAWLIGVHVDRSPAYVMISNLRGARPRRELPHVYYLRAIEATLQAIAAIEPHAKISMVIFSEDRSGVLIDETGVPVDWDVPNEICKDIGLSCTQVRKLQCHVFSL